MKNTEEIFITLCVGNKSTPRDIIDHLVEFFGFNKKQLYYYLEKWTKKGFYDYGVALDLGWINTERLSEQYRLAILRIKRDMIEVI